MTSYTMHLSMGVVLCVPNVVLLSRDLDPKLIANYGVPCYRKKWVIVKKILTMMMTERYVILYRYFQVDKMIQKLLHNHS